LKKRSEKLKLETEAVAKTETTWNEWINVPNEDNSIMRVKLNFNKTFLQSLKSFLYKDEEFFIRLKFDNGSTFRYKFVPKNAVDGLWINPVVYNVETSFKVEQIKFECSNEKIISKNLKLEFEKIIIDKEDFNWFDNFPDYKNPIASITNDFELDSLPFWFSRNENVIIDENSYSGKKIQKIESKGYSSTFEFQLDSIKEGENFIILIDCMVKMLENYRDKNGMIFLIISIHDKDNNTLIWEYTIIHKNLTYLGRWNNFKLPYLNRWNHINRTIEFPKENNFKTLKVDIWNNSEKDVCIDDFTVNVY